MANSTTTNPLVFDTAGASSAITRPVGIKAIYWDGPANANDVCLLHDAQGGNIVFKRTAPAANIAGDVLHFDQPLVVKGLYLTTLASGTLLVYEG
jgi:hypothetical protein